MKRGWILIFSVFLEVVAIVGLFFLFPITVIGGIATLPLVFLVLPFVLIYFWWAPNNLFFTFVPEGRAKIVVRGDAFREALIQWEGHDLARRSSDDIDVWDVIERPDQPRRFWGGLRFYGFWPIVDIFVYSFSWTGVAQDGQVQSHTKELLDYILVKVDVYWAQVRKAEDKQMLPLDVELVLTIRVINPYKALFRVQNWLETVINRIEPAVRDAITEDTYERWISEEKDLADRLISDKETQELLKELRSSFGIEVSAIEVRSINPTTAELDESRKATLKRYFAEKERDRITVEADAERQRLEAVYKAIHQFGDLGKLVRTLEALERAPGQGASAIIIPGLAEVVAQAFPGRTPDSLRPDEIRALRDIIQRLAPTPAAPSPPSSPSSS
jgi:regulator of protease activity HflC (stomatin/prohibitin superfamily)